MENLGWGLMMMLVGMGVVFALLAALMGLLMLIGRLDRVQEDEGSSYVEAFEAFLLNEAGTARRFPTDAGLRARGPGSRAGRVTAAILRLRDSG